MSCSACESLADGRLWGVAGGAWQPGTTPDCSGTLAAPDSRTCTLPPFPPHRGFWGNSSWAQARARQFLGQLGLAS